MNIDRRKRKGEPARIRRPARADGASAHAASAARNKPANVRTASIGDADAAPTLILKEGRERSLLRKHPWIFSGAVEHMQGKQSPGLTVAVLGADGRFLAWAALSPDSNIRARVWSFDEAQPPGEELFSSRIRSALLRRHLDFGGGRPLRILHSEADGLPGLIADRYGDTLVVQISSSGAERWRRLLLQLLFDETGCMQIYERSDADVRTLEGLEPRCGFVVIADGIVTDSVVATLEGAESSTVISENGIKYEVDFAGGQKTGFFLDQRDSRQAVREAATVLVGAVQAGTPIEVLNCFCYTGGFSLAALAGGANSVMSVDSSGPALDIARRNLKLNGFDESRAEWLEADVFKQLRTFRDAGRSFDLIVLDPPKFAPTARDAERAARGYKDINLSALRLLRPGGYLATFSCSGGISADLFQKIVAGAAADAGVSCYIEKRFSASNDHPVLMEFPEGEYLKGLLLRRAA
jgi:23S rRNA (cytosine1962-C5)-methyltransferase